MRLESTRSLQTRARVVVAQNSPNSFFFGASSFPPFPPFPHVVFALLDVVAAAIAAPRHRPSRARRSRARDRPLKLPSRPERGRRLLRALRLALVLVDLSLLLRHASLNLLRVDVRPEPTEAFDLRARRARASRRRRPSSRRHARRDERVRARHRHRARRRHRVVLRVVALCRDASRPRAFGVRAARRARREGARARARGARRPRAIGRSRRTEGAGAGGAGARAVGRTTNDAIERRAAAMR